MQKVLSYIRIAPKKSQYTEQYQQDRLHSLAESNGWHIVQAYQDTVHPHISSAEGLLSCINHALQEDLAILLLEVDKLGEQFAQAQAQFKHLAVTFIFAEVGIESDIRGIDLLIRYNAHHRNTLDRRRVEGIQQAKARGVRLGNPDMPRIQHLGVEAIKRKSREHYQRNREMITTLRNNGLSYSKIAEHFNEHSIATPRGGRWHATSISNIHKALTKEGA